MNQVLRSKILLLPLASFGVVMLLLLILFGPLRESRGAAFDFALSCIPFCWLCSIANGFYAVKRKNAVFPKLEKTSSVLLCLSLLSFIASWLLTEGDLMAPAILWMSDAVWCLVSLLITLFIIIRDVRDLHTWVIFVTQIFWVVVAFCFLILAASISAAC